MDTQMSLKAAVLSAFAMVFGMFGAAGIVAVIAVTSGIAQ